MLAVDFDQRRAERLEHLHAHRLVVDEGARAPVGELHAAQDQVVLGRDAVFGEQRERRMVRRDVERRGHLALLGALAHQARIAAAPSASAKASSRIDLPAPVSPVSTDEAGRIVDVEPFDQDDVADGEAGEHGLQSSSSAKRG